MTSLKIPRPGTLLLVKSTRIPTFYKANENDEGERRTGWNQGGWRRNIDIQKDMQENDLVMFLREITFVDDSCERYGLEFLFERRNVSIWLGDIKHLPPSIRTNYFWFFFKKADIK